MVRGAMAIAPPGGGRIRRMPETVNRERLLETFRTLQRFGGNERGGLDRLAYSEADLAAREYLTGLLRQAGAAVHTDIAGNLVARLEGASSGPPWVVGSHIDSVPDGGHYDGQVGSVGSVEVVRRLAELDVELRRPLELLIFQNEEGGKTGSRALSGEVQPFELELETASGFTIAQGIDRLGGDASALASARRRPGSIAGFFELHVEQGGVLDGAGIPIGVVQGIVGIRRWTVTVTGFANHAGTTPMHQRRDAMVGAAGFIAAVNRITSDLPGTEVATVGRLQAFPGAPNVIPGRVTMSLEIRHLSMDAIAEHFDRLRAAAEDLGRETGTTFAFDEFYVSRAAPTTEDMRAHVRRAAEALDLRHHSMPSGAGHDAQSMARLGPVGMIFVPSVAGISHSPEEHTTDTDIVNGANVLLGAVLGADRVD